MNTQSIVSGRFGGRRTACGAVILMALFGIMPVSTIADQRAATASVSRVADVPLTDLDLSTPAGMRTARERLQAMAESVCAEPAKSRGLPRQPNFAVCVDSTVAAHLKQIDALRRHNVTVSNSLTRAANVSLADLDLSTPEGARIARERLEAIARRICGELARGQHLSYQPNYAGCVQDSLARALAQADALAAARSIRTAGRSAP
jgi:UrcA family protein